MKGLSQYAAIVFFMMAAFLRVDTAAAKSNRPIYTFTIDQAATPQAYDEAVAVACLQGIINRDSPELYILSSTNSLPQYWLGVLTKDGRWLHGRKCKKISSLDALVKLAGKRLEGAIIWDPSVPATLNVATTCAGVENAVVLSPDMAALHSKKWKLRVLHDFRGQFTGAETGSAKNDAYRWVIRHFLATGQCSAHRLCLFEDSFATRAHGDARYVVTRDWAVKNRSFVFDLSPWGDEAPLDDPHQRPGTDLETYRMILAGILRLSNGRQMTEMTGFFAVDKYSDTPIHHSSHLGVPTEWESVALITPFNVYQNTISSDCLNQSFHSQAPRHPLKQKYADPQIALEKKSYVCILMGDYDSATPLYQFLPKFWNNPGRGKLPLTWAIDPSLLETYPDLIAYYYETATPEDTFASDASAAGYDNPDFIDPRCLPLFVKHNKKFFGEADMTIAPMVLDQNPPTPAVKDAYRQFAPDGYATILATVQGARGTYPPPQVWRGMPVMELLNDTCNSTNAPAIAAVMANVIHGRGGPAPGFYFFRTDWVSPGTVNNAMNLLRSQHPELKCELLPARTFFRLYRQSLEGHRDGTR